MTDFAALESRANQAVMRSLGNADATLGGVSVRGVFERTPAQALGVGGYEPMFVLPTSSHPADPRGLVLVVAGADSYTVRGWSPDGSGLSTLILEQV